MSITIDQLHARGRAAWPTIDLDADRFAAWVAGLRPDDADGPIAAEDLYLVAGYCAGLHEAARLLVRTYQDEALAFARRLGVPDAQARDAWQVVLQRLFEAGTTGTGGAYTGRGALRRWIHVALGRIAARHGKAQRRESSDDAALESRLDGGVSPEVTVLRQLYAQPFAEAFQAALAQLGARDRSLLRMYYLDGLGVAELGRLHRVHTSTAARWLERCRAALLDGTRDALRVRLAVSTEEFESLARLIASELEVSLLQTRSGAWAGEAPA